MYFKSKDFVSYIINSTIFHIHVSLILIIMVSNVIHVINDIKELNY